MLIKLDKSVLNGLETNNYKVIKKGLELIAIAVEEGKHFVIAEREVLIKIIDSPRINEEAKYIYSQLLKKYSSIAAIVDYVTTYILVVDQKQAKVCTQSRDIQGKPIYQVSISYFDKTEKISRLNLVCENIEDCVFYERLANKYIEEKAYGIGINIEKVPGGGSSTYQSYENSLNEKKPSLVILDSDKKAYNDKLGSTANQALRVYSKYSKNHLTDLYVLEVREKENLIPPSIYSLCNKSKHYKQLDVLEAIYNNPDSNEEYKYLDIKDGISYYELSKNKGIKVQLEKIINNSINPDKKLLNKESHEFSEEEKKKKILDGLEVLTKHVHNDVFNGEILKYIKKKESMLEDESKLKTVQKERLIDELYKLRENYKKSKSLLTLISNDPILLNDWEMISQKILTWGCYYKIR